jgi:hypothetical protein
MGHRSATWPLPTTNPQRQQRYRHGDCLAATVLRYENALRICPRWCVSRRSLRECLVCSQDKKKQNGIGEIEVMDV